MNEVGCYKCWASSAELAFVAITGKPIESYFVNESHFIVSIRKCGHCFQKYLQVTTEIVDLYDGDDAIYRTIIPIDHAELERLLNSEPFDYKIIETIGISRQSIRHDRPKGEKAIQYWSRGIHIGIHD